MLIEFLVNIVRAVYRYFFKTTAMDKSKLKIYIKWGTDTVVPVHLNDDWTVKDLKSVLSKKVNVDESELRIIFAGKELLDDVQLQDCDMGEQSIIHAVPYKKPPLEVTAKRKAVILPLSACLLGDESEYSEGFRVDKKKTYFFVYCSYPCKDMVPGKLRVRCSICKEGTLTLDKDPTCWDDVLIPGRISGTCQAESCDGSIADFYFKCAKHVTSPGDTAVALYLIKNNFKNVPCIACTDVRPIVLVFPCVDQHVICIECFQLYCLSCLNERKFIQDEQVGYTINCAAGCSDSLIKEPHHFKLLGEEQYSRYQQFGAEECLIQAGGVLCPHPGCGAGLLPDPSCRRVVCLKQGGGGCGFVFCRLCLQGFHVGSCETLQSEESTDGYSCSITDVRAGSSRWDEDSNKTIKTITKPCPKCRTPTERDGGCMHMVCTRAQCGFHWCWICQDEWSRDCMGNHWFG